MSTFKFKSEYMCNAEWASNPSQVEVYLHDEWQERIKIQAQALKDSGGHVMITWWAGAFEFFGEEGEEFTPEYSVDGCHLHVFADGDFRFLFPFKHSGEEGFTLTMRWADGVLMEEEA